MSQQLSGKLPSELVCCINFDSKSWITSIPKYIWCQHNICNTKKSCVIVIFWLYIYLCNLCILIYLNIYDELISSGINHWFNNSLSLFLKFLTGHEIEVFWSWSCLRYGLKPTLVILLLTKILLNTIDAPKYLVIIFIEFI